MNKIKEIKLYVTNWIEVTIVNENNEVIHCESFGDSDEYQELLKERCLEFEVELSEDNLLILEEQKNKRHIPTPEEIAQQQAEEAKRLLEQQLVEAQAYLNNTDYYYPRFLETGESVPEEVVLKRTEAREFIRFNKVVV